MEAHIVLTAGKDAIDADGVLSEVACDIESSAIVAVEESSALELDLQACVRLVVAGTRHEVELLGVPDEAQTALLGVVETVGVASIERDVQIPDGVEGDFRLYARPLSMEESCGSRDMPMLGGEDLLAEVGVPDLDVSLGVIVIQAIDDGEDGLQG